MLCWANAGQTALLVAERDPANRITQVNLGSSSSVVASGLPARLSSAVLIGSGRMLVCSDSVIPQVDFIVSVVDPAGPLLMGIGFVPFDKIDLATGLASTADPYFYRVVDAPFGGTLPVMINHQRAANLGATHYRVKIDGSSRSAT